MPAKVKAALLAEAGEKCANPGCPARRVHLHHIREWAVYETNDAADMIAVCPNCHDAIHHGEIEITDETLYRWKQIPRARGVSRGQVYVEPGTSSRLRVGSIEITGREEVKVFDLGGANKLSFRVVDEEIFRLNLGITTTDGVEILRVQEGQVRHEERQGVDFTHVAGQFEVTVPATEQFLAPWALKCLREKQDPSVTSGRMSLLRIAVLDPGLVQVCGVWNAEEHVVLIDDEKLGFLMPTNQVLWYQRWVEDEAEDGYPVFVHDGPINLFALAEEHGLLRVPSRTPKLGRNDPCWCLSGLKFKKCHGR